MLNPNVAAALETFGTRSLRLIAKSSSTTGRFTWAEIQRAAEIVEERKARGE